MLEDTWDAFGRLGKNSQPSIGPVDEFSAVVANVGYPTRGDVRGDAPRDIPNRAPGEYSY